MPAEQFDMHHPDVAASGRTTQAAYDTIWFPLGWRKRLPTETSSSPDEDSNITPSEED